MNYSFQRWRMCETQRHEEEEEEEEESEYVDRRVLNEGERDVYIRTRLSMSSC